MDLALATSATLMQFPMSLLTAPATDIGILARGDFGLFIGSWNPGGIADTSYLDRYDTIRPNARIPERSPLRARKVPRSWN